MFKSEHLHDRLVSLEDKVQDLNERLEEEKPTIPKDIEQKEKS